MKKQMEQIKDNDTIVVWFSCGAASAVAAWLTLRCYGHRCKVRVVNNYIKQEDADNRRFLADVEQWLGMTFERAESSKYPAGDCVEVWEDRQYISGTKGAPCTTWLKKKARQEFEDRNPHEWIVMGFTADEQKRHNNFVKTERPNLLPILIEAGLTKEDCFQLVTNRGIELPLMYRLGYPNANCFSGTERFLTQEYGYVAFKDVVGKEVSVLGREMAWKKAVVKSYGIAPIVELDVQRNGSSRTIRTTANHRWDVPRYINQSQGISTVTTSDLPIGKNLMVGHAVLQSNYDEEGVRNGIVYGDGNLYYSNGDKNGRRFSAIQFCGEKECLARYFPDKCPNESGKINGLDPWLKRIPDSSRGHNYLTGFIVGLIATDGNVSKSGVSISTTKAGDANAIHRICQSLGLISRVKALTRDTNYKKNSTIYTVVIPKSCFRIWHFLRPFHREKFGANHTRPKSWRVTGIRNAASSEEVYCVEVKELYDDFILEGNILTRNCIGCVKATSPTYWNHVRKVHPQEFAERAEQSRRIGCKLTRHKGKRLFLDELPADAVGRPMKSLKMPECTIFCEEKS